MLAPARRRPGARPVLRELHADVGHTVHFAMLSGDEAVYLEKLVDPNLPYQFASRVGGRIPLHCTAIGKALLAAMAPEEARALLGRRELVRRTPNTLVTVAAIARRAGPDPRARASRSTTRRTSATSAASAPPCVDHRGAPGAARSACRR